LVLYNEHMVLKEEKESLSLGLGTRSGHLYTENLNRCPYIVHMYNEEELCKEHRQVYSYVLTVQCNYLHKPMLHSPNL